ncbi:MAG: peptide deformylase [Candidatus Latescibacteria bacterium]|nr:peptide deformylase [Candidatus Latescibacterota bacterium]
MSILKVCRMGHPALRTPARPLSSDELASEPIQRLIDDMLDTMEDYAGIGLAAPQVGLPLRLIVLGQESDEDDEPPPVPRTILANPQWRHLSPVEEDDWEGCLSIPDMRGLVPRHRQVVVQGLDRAGRPVTIEAEEFYARVLQHEVDHLDAVLYLDRMKDLRSLTFVEEYQRYWAFALDP